MAENAAPQSPSDRFPALKPLEESVERAKLRQALAEADAAALKAKLPSLDVEVQHDTVVMSDKTTGLARILVQLDSLTLADDIADRALDSARAAGPATKKRSYVFHLVSDPAVFKDVDAQRLLEQQLALLSARLNSYAPKPPPKAKGILPAAAAVPALVGVGIQAVGLVTKLLAHEYTLSGTQVAVDDLGFDLEIAHALRKNVKPDEDVRVEVERVMPTPGSSKILGAIQQLAVDADERLSPKVAEAAAELDQAVEGLEAANAEIVAIDNQLVELSKRVPDKLEGAPARKGAKPKPTSASPLLDEIRRLTADRAALRDRLPGLRETVARKRDAHDRGALLLTDIAAFITSALTPGSNARAPALQAARAEARAATTQSGTHFVLYARLIAGGIDQEVEKKLGPDRSLIVAGTTAEFALLSPDGSELLASKVLSLLEASTMKLADPDSFSRHRMDYMDFHRARTENGGGG